MYVLEQLLVILNRVILVMVKDGDEALLSLQSR